MYSILIIVKYFFKQFETWFELNKTKSTEYSTELKMFIEHKKKTVPHKTKLVNATELDCDNQMNKLWFCIFAKRINWSHARFVVCLFFSSIQQKFIQSMWFKQIIQIVMYLVLSVRKLTTPIPCI